MQITRYSIVSNKNINLRAALVADLHNNPNDKIISALKKEKTNIIFVAGDLMNSLDNEDVRVNAKNLRGFSFLKEASKIAPVFYALGNHEKQASPKNTSKILKTGAVLLDDSYVNFEGIKIGGLSSGINRNDADKPNLAWLGDFEKGNDCKILLCHHPEYYEKYIKDKNIDLVLSGHAHGGHWRFFGRGVFAPGQGLFPKYTSGVHENRLVISRGLGDHTFIPRIGNPTELVIIDII